LNAIGGIDRDCTQGRIYYTARLHSTFEIGVHFVQDILVPLRGREDFDSYERRFRDSNVVMAEVSRFAMIDRKVWRKRLAFWRE